MATAFAKPRRMLNIVSGDSNLICCRFDLHPQPIRSVAPDLPYDARRGQEKHGISQITFTVSAYNANHVNWESA